MSRKPKPIAQYSCPLSVKVSSRMWTWNSPSHNAQYGTDANLHVLVRTKVDERTVYAYTQVESVQEATPRTERPHQGGPREPA